MQDTLWTANEAGQLICYDALTGLPRTAVPLASEAAAKAGWRAVGLTLTKTHILVTGSDGTVRWLSLPGLLALCDAADAAAAAAAAAAATGTAAGGEQLITAVDSVAAAADMALLCELTACVTNSSTGGRCPAAAAACSPLYDKLVVGSADGHLHCVMMDPARHDPAPTAAGLTVGAALTAAAPGSGGGVSTLRSFHAGRCVAAAGLRPLALEAGEGAKGVLCCAGEDGVVRLYSTNR
jgi:hypothetical protein